MGSEMCIRDREDPHIAEKGLFKPVDYPGLNNPAPLMKTPVELSKTPGEIRKRPPTLGEHTDEIMRELGFSQDQISDLREKRVV